MDETDGRMLLRKRDLVEKLGVAKSTVADWVTEFQVFIPTIKDGALTLYKPEALEVLNAIKVMREQNLPKAEIYALLQQKGFPVTVEEAADEVQRAIGRLDGRKQLLDVMNQLGNAVERVADLKERQDAQDGRVTELERTVQELKTELTTVRAELEKKQRPWWTFWR